MTIFQAVILGIVEGITEFLPVSSTGHMIVASSLMGIHQEAFTKLFEVAIQFGTILSVVVLYWRKFFDFTKIDFYLKLLVAVIPALILGALFSKKIDALLESPTTVAIMLIIGGVFFLFIDGFFGQGKITEEPQISYKSGFVVGFWQCVAMIPGVSRSAASIIGGLQQGFTRKLAAEFSFFLAVPTMAAATGYKLLKAWLENPEMISNSQNLTALAIGNLVGFLVAIIAIKFLIGFVQKFGLKYFGWYRIIAGIVILILLSTGIMHA
jgi:undecaprenyl-diphosphatase